MEDVDAITLRLLKENTPLDAEVSGFGSFTSDTVYETCLSLVRKIDGSKTETFPQLLPRNMSTKVNVGSELAAAIKALGYKGDISYHQLLYPNAQDLRRLFMWLLEALPKKNDDTPAGTVGPDLQEQIAKHFTALLQQTWVPSFAGQHGRDGFSLSAVHLTYPSKGRKLKSVPGLEKYYHNYLPYLSRQVSYKPQVAPSIFETNLACVTEHREWDNEWNTKGLDSKLNPMAYKKRKSEQIAKMVSGVLRNAMNAVAAEQVARMNAHMEATLQQNLQAAAQGQFGRKLLYTQKDEELTAGSKLSEEEQEKQRESEIAALEAELSELQAARAKCEEHLQQLAEALLQIEQTFAAEDAKTEGLEREYKIKKRTFDLLPNADENIAQLKELSNESSDRLKSLAAEWENHRIPLIEQYRKLRDAAEGRRGESEAKVGVIKEMRAQMRELMEEVRNKEERYRELLEAFSKLPKDSSRSHYTTRIFEIVKSVKKQKIDIDKVLIDTRNLQKELNSINDTLSRTFTVTEELVFADAKKEAAAKEAYKKLIELNEQFQRLTKGVEESGHNKNAILHLEAKVQAVQGQQASLNFERLDADLKEIREENVALEQRVAMAKVTG